MQNFSTIRLIVRGASQKNLSGGGINPPPARARVKKDRKSIGRVIVPLILSFVCSTKDFAPPLRSLARNNRSLAFHMADRISNKELTNQLEKVKCQ